MSVGSLTDFEIRGLGAVMNLADGHAYQDLAEGLAPIVGDLPQLWEASALTSIPEAEERFRSAFAVVAGAAGMLQRSFFKICPSASNSVDVIGAVLKSLGLKARLVEPTFDNLALLLRRRGVAIEPYSEGQLVNDVALRGLVQDKNRALFVVHPNNPTGFCFSHEQFSQIAAYCASNETLLIIDNSFRLYNRHPFDDYTILSESGVSYICFEDTGKVWPTHDLKASLLFCSEDLEEIVNTIYNELYLCASRFALALLEKFAVATAQTGLEDTVWRTADTHRALLRRVLRGTSLVVDESAVASQISVEWLSSAAMRRNDLDVTAWFESEGLRVLPGRLFFWHSSHVTERQYNVRVALMKPTARFQLAMAALEHLLADSRQGSVTAR